MTDHRVGIVVALVFATTSQSVIGQDGPNIIQHPRVVQVLWNGPGQRTARDSTDFLL